MSPAEQPQVKQLQAEFKTSQAQFVAAHKALLAHLQSITGVQAEQHKRTKLAVSDDGKHIVVV